MKKFFIVLLFTVLLSLNSCAALKLTDQRVTEAFAKYETVRVLYKQVREYVIENQEDLNIPDNFWVILEKADKKAVELDGIVMSIKSVKEATRAQIRALEAAGKIITGIIL